MTNQEIANLLRQVAAAYTIKRENRFKIIAYEKAADTISGLNNDLQDLWKEGKLFDLPGIGKAIGGYLDELFRKGVVRHFNQVLAQLPASMFPLMELSGFGAKKAYKLVTSLKLKNPKTAVEDLANAAKQGKIAPIEGFGEKSQQEILEAINRFKKGQKRTKRMPLAYAYEIANNVIEYLVRHQDTKEAVPLGSLRRMLATIGDIDIAVSTNNPEAVLDWFINYPKKFKVIEKGPSGATIILLNGTQVDLRVQKPEMFGAMLQYFTGSKRHNIHLRELALRKGLSLNEYGIKPIKKTKNLELSTKNFDQKMKLYTFSNEIDFYQALGLPLITPEIREDTGEIEASIVHNLPKLVELTDIKGEFHIHTNYNLEPSHDLGASPLSEILNNASKLGYEYVGISDHNPSIGNHTSSQIVSILKRRKANYEQILSSLKSVRVKLLIMLEIDILPNGKLAVPDEAFNYLDAAIVSVHSSFHMDKESMTKRVLLGLSHPKAKILAHPTGRLLERREGYELDWAKIFAFCKERNKAIEINSYPDRLDLPDYLVRQAVDEKVKLTIDTDSHAASQMDLIKYGVFVARRGWATKDDIINTMPYNEMKEWLEK